MGRREIIQVLKSEEQINKDKHLTPKEINKGLKNLGVMCRQDWLNKVLIDMRKKDIIKVKDKDSFRKQYIINKATCQD